MTTFEEAEAAVDRLTVTALRVKQERDRFLQERDRFRAALADVLGELESARAGLEGCSDVEDGGPDRPPRANWAMRLVRVADRYERVLG